MSARTDERRSFRPMRVDDIRCSGPFLARNGYEPRRATPLVIRRLEAQQARRNHKRSSWLSGPNPIQKITPLALPPGSTRANHTFPGGPEPSPPVGSTEAILRLPGRNSLGEVPRTPRPSFDGAQGMPRAVQTVDELTSSVSSLVKESGKASIKFPSRYSSLSDPSSETSRSKWRRRQFLRDRTRRLLRDTCEGGARRGGVGSTGERRRGEAGRPGSGRSIDSQSRAPDTPLPACLRSPPWPGARSGMRPEHETRPPLPRP